MKALWFVAVMLWCGANALAQYEQALSGQLLKHTVVMRNYYTGSDLKFDAEGKLISGGTPGFGPTDGRVYLQQVHLLPDRLTLIGQRTFPVYDTKTGDFKLTTIGDQVTIEVALQAGKPANETVPDLLRRILLSQIELDQVKTCSPQEQQDFRKLLESVSTKQSKKKSKKAKNDTSPGPSADEPDHYCLPDGEKSSRVGHGVLPPKAVKLPDPEYSEAARREKIQGTVVLLLIVDAEGRPTSLHVVRPAGYGLDEAALRAVQNWQFKPATSNGAPVPVAINVEVNFGIN